MRPRITVRGLVSWLAGVYILLYVLYFLCDLARMAWAHIDLSPTAEGISLSLLIFGALGLIPAIGIVCALSPRRHYAHPVWIVNAGYPPERP